MWAILRKNFNYKGVRNVSRVPSLLSRSYGSHKNIPQDSIVNVKVSSKGIKVYWKSGTSSFFHSIWLRDNCQCPNCHFAMQRTSEPNTLYDSLKPKKIEVFGNELEVAWTGDLEHKSRYNSGWLLENSYHPRGASKLQEEKYFWDSNSIRDQNPVVEYNEVMEGTQGLKKWLELLNTFGFALVDGVPPVVEKTKELAQRISFLRETHYGGFWDFSANMEFTDTAYSQMGIGAHTDTTYFTDPVGLQMFHLVEFDGKGGESLLVDGFSVAKKFKEKYPTYFKTLSTLRIGYHWLGEGNTMIQPSPAYFPIINVDPSTKGVYQIRHNHYDRAPLRHFNNKDVERFYEAYNAWTRELQDKENEFWMQLQPGRVLIFDNWRILHGRSSFTGNRRMIGCYINMDDYLSRLRAVREEEREEVLQRASSFG